MFDIYLVYYSFYLKLSKAEEDVHSAIESFPPLLVYLPYQIYAFSLSLQKLNYNCNVVFIRRISTDFADYVMSANSEGEMLKWLSGIQTLKSTFDKPTSSTVNS